MLTPAELIDVRDALAEGVHELESQHEAGYAEDTDVRRLGRWSALLQKIEALAEPAH